PLTEYDYDGALYTSVVHRQRPPRDRAADTRLSVRDIGHASGARAMGQSYSAADIGPRRAARHADRSLRASESALVTRRRRAVNRDLPRSARVRVAIVVYGACASGADVELRGDPRAWTARDF